MSFPSFFLVLLSVFFLLPVGVMRAQCVYDDKGQLKDNPDIISKFRYLEKNSPPVLVKFLEEKYTYCGEERKKAANSGKIGSVGGAIAVGGCAGVTTGAAILGGLMGGPLGALVGAGIGLLLSAGTGATLAVASKQASKANAPAPIDGKELMNYFETSLMVEMARHSKITKDDLREGRLEKLRPYLMELSDSLKCKVNYEIFEKNKKLYSKLSARNSQNGTITQAGNNRSNVNLARGGGGAVGAPVVNNGGDSLSKKAPDPFLSLVDDLVNIYEPLFLEKQYSQEKINAFVRSTYLICCSFRDPIVVSDKTSAHKMILGNLLKNYCNGQNRDVRPIINTFYEIKNSLRDRFFMNEENNPNEIYSNILKLLIGQKNIGEISGFMKTLDQIKSELDENERANKTKIVLDIEDTEIQKKDDPFLTNILKYSNNGVSLKAISCESNDVFKDTYADEIQYDENNVWIYSFQANAFVKITEDRLMTYLKSCKNARFIYSR